MDSAVTTTPQEFSNNEVRFTIHRKPACIVEYDVEVFPELLKAAHKKAIRGVAKEVILPGFRKGKAPDDLVLKNYGKQIDKQWQQEIANLALEACQKLSSIPLLQRDGKVSFHMKSHSLEGAKLTLSFESDPVIPLVDPTQFTAKEVKRPEVNEEKVEETVRQIRFFFAEWKEITDRPVKEGDYVILDVESLEETPPSKIFNHTRFEVGEKGMAKWMLDLVLGMELHTSKEGISVPDEQATAEEKETLQPQKVRITLKTIEEATLPELTDDFAQKLGVESLAELHKGVERLLNKKADEHVTAALREQASEFLLTHYPFDMPTAVIHRETQFRMQELMRDPNFQKYWNTMRDPQRKEVVQSILKQSEKAVRMFYLCRKMLADAHITVSPQDLPEPPMTALDILLNPEGMTQTTPPKDEVRLAEAYSRLVLEKAEDFLIERANKT